ncbi:MAG: hypothetical protein LCI02_03570 [Proteobacteria bacterium]|nr:hypothetical protein [Pseudomonadota bacterium]
MSNVLRFNGATRHDPPIDAWFAARRPELAAIARAWFGQMRGCGADEPSAPGHGMALRNVRERLRLLHDVGGQRDAGQDEQGFHAHITVPL